MTGRGSIGLRHLSPNPQARAAMGCWRTNKRSRERNGALESVFGGGGGGGCGCNRCPKPEGTEVDMGVLV